MTDRIVELCQRYLAFIRLTKGQKPKRDAFYEFKNKKLTADVLDELNYQFLRRLQKEGFITLKSLFIDGTKIEANANIQSEKGILRPKIHTEKKKYESPEEVQVLKILISTGDSYFKI